VVGLVFGPVLAVFAIIDPALALVTLAGIVLASVSASLIQFWFRAQVKRSLFRRRHVSSRIATFAEAFSSILWSSAGAVAPSHLVLAAFPAAAALVVLGGAWLIRPRRG
jgi:ABC-2 type transport system permease protein